MTEALDARVKKLKRNALYYYIAAILIVVVCIFLQKTFGWPLIIPSMILLLFIFWVKTNNFYKEYIAFWVSQGMSKEEAKMKYAKEHSHDG